MKTWYLWGYMGSGKSSLGRAVARKHELEFQDLDELIVRESGLSVSDFIDQKGELSFRKLERQLLIENEGFEGILSCGGGTPCYYDNADWMVEHGQTIYLSASVGWLHQRLAASRVRGTKRPLLSGVADDDLAEFIAKHLFERMPFYERADHVVEVSSKSVDQLVEELKGLLQVG